VDERFEQGRPDPHRRTDTKAVTASAVPSLAAEEHERLETQLRDVQRLESLGVLAGTIAHNLNNQLTVILGNCSLAQADLDPDSPIRRRLDRVREAAQQSAGLAEQLLNYSGSPEAEPKSIHLPHLLESIRELLDIAVGRQCELCFEGPARVPLIVADEGQIRQVVLNLVTNAAESLERRAGHVWVRLGVDRASASETVSTPEERETAFVYIEVEDDGSGIEAEARARIFEPFFTSRLAGRGLGLSAVRGIVRAHGGLIELDTTPGSGTTVRVLFPQAGSGNAPEP
jgi:two-component system cell cycle sensor histidine kinase/response regulator CckA